jgi:hypothetical protein
MLSLSRTAIASVVFLCTVLRVTIATAQSRDPDELLAAYVSEWQTPNVPSSAHRDLIHALNNHGDYPPADLETLLRGLEHLALAGTSPRFRAEAALALAIPGSRRAVHPIRKTFARLGRVYRRSSDPLVRSVLIAAMGNLVDPSEAAISLERVAKQDPADFAGAQGKAVQSLLRMGEEGRVVLKRLHETGAVRDPETKLTLAYLAKNGFRRP